MISFTDTHAHLSMLAQRGIDPIARLDALFAEGFGAILDVGTKADDLEDRIRRFGRFPFVGFSAGIWPSRDAIRNRRAELETLARSIDLSEGQSIVAIGECGLDRHWNKREEGADIAGERELFAAQAELAVRLDLPLIVHSREAATETAEVLAAVPRARGVIHCYSYGQDEARTFLDLGFHLSFAGTVTYKNAQEQKEAARYVPEDRILLETDSPYLAPLPFRGKSAEPGMIERSYEAVAELRGTSAARLAEIVAKNAHALFGLPTRS